MANGATVVALLLLACLPAGAEAATPQPNVVLFFIDTLRADRVHCLGYPRHTSPAFDQVASQGTLFETAIAPSSWSLPSYCSILSSLHPPTHAVTELAQYFDTSFVTLPKILAANGYATGGFVGGGHLSRRFGLDNGFATYRDEPHFGSFYHAIPRVLDWLDAGARKGPFFALIQGYDVHSPYQPPLGFSEMWDPEYRGLVHERDLLNADVIRNISDNVARLPVGTATSSPAGHSSSSSFGSSILDVPPGTRLEEIPLSDADCQHIAAHYDGAVTYADSWLGVFREELRVRGLLDNTILVVASDHGESLGEHGYYGHHLDLYEEQLHVPLVFSGPGIASGRRLREVIGLVDLAPTVLELCSVTACREFQGQSLVSLLRAAESPPSSPPDAAAFSSIINGLSIRTSRWHMILRETGQSMLYDLGDDPQERKDVSAAHPKERELMRSLLLDWFEKHRRPPRAPDARLSLEERQMFRQKGYW